MPKKQTNNSFLSSDFKPPTSKSKQQLVSCCLFSKEGEVLFSELSSDFTKQLSQYLQSKSPFLFIKYQNENWKIERVEQEGKILFKAYRSESNYQEKLLELFYAAFEESYDGVIITDEEGKVVYLNRNYTRFLQVKLDESIGKPVAEIIPGTRMPIVLETRKPEIGALWNLKGRPIIVSRFPLFNAGGELSGSIGLIMFRRSVELTELIQKIYKMEKKLEYFNQKNLDAGYRVKYSFDDISTTSFIMKRLIQKAQKIAVTSSNVLLQGESGTGKELIAHAMHDYSSRNTGPFVKVNCGAIPESLFESELFGYEEGAFTGSRKGGKPGKFELANNGTIFLDEIGEMPLDMQVKLLRVIQERELERIGGMRIRAIDIRIIAASNKNLLELVHKGKFREDLYYRLNVYHLSIPSLKERKEDIPYLTGHFMRQMEKEMDIGTHVLDISDEALQLLKSYNWPGNVRELRNVIEMTAGLLEGKMIQKENLPAYLLSQNRLHVLEKKELEINEELDYWGNLHKLERKLIIQALQKTKGEKKKAANILGVARSLIYKKMKELGIQEKHIFF